MSMVETHEELLELLIAGKTLTPYAAGEHIFEEGDAGDGMYVMGSGTVVLKHGDHVVETVTAPGLFGEMALVEREPRALTAVAESDAELLKLTERQFWVLVHETPYFARLVMRVMSRRLRHAAGTT
jgi:CRP/FNR family cyclic AMP-dependent transcriptional regulator